MLEDRLIEHAPRLVACVAVQLVRLRQQLQMSVDVRHAGRDVVRDGGEFGFEFLALPSDVAQLATDARGVDAAVCREVDEVVFLGREPLQLGLRLLLQHLLRADLVVDGGFHQNADGLNELRSERDGLVVPFDGFLDAVHVRVGSVAGMVLHAAAEEVRVRRLRLAVHVHENHAAVGVGFESAPSAPDRALEVMVVLASALT
ncbi:hypothetical protein [Microbacterium sp. HMWF026]|uniref:hypothetical protein n=1 Tax=Microbacterium sp. HMWF026 TaxID=2056861 RepID=UPI002159ECB5|nr:hypothetical protein [Microbacterium sp. HMWF026]